MSREIALITGASSGIGEALAGEFAAGGFDLVIAARSEDKLQELAKQLLAEYDVQVHVQVCDLSKRGAAKKLQAALKRDQLQMTAVVNNAGVLEHGLFAEMTPARHQQLIDLNISGLTSLLAEFLPGMVKRGRGRVLNVASIASFQPVPSLATYAATKAYVLSLTESLSEELVGTGVTATALCPGITATNMVSNAKEKSQGLKIPEFVIGDVAEVAGKGYRACMKGDVVCVPGMVNQVSTLSGRAAPRWLMRRVSGIVGRYSTRK